MKNAVDLCKPESASDGKTYLRLLPIERIEIGWNDMWVVDFPRLGELLPRNWEA